VRAHGSRASRGAFLGLLVIVGVFAATSTAATRRAPKIVASFRLSSAPQAIAVGDGGVWLTTLGSLVRLDPRTNTLGSRLRLKPILGAVAISGGELWLARNPIDTGQGAPAKSQLWSIDAVSGQVRGRPVPVGLIVGLATTANAVWVTNGNHAQYGRLFRIDRRHRTIAATAKVSGAPSGIIVARGLLWIACSDTGYLYRVDPQTATLVGKPIHAGRALLTIAAGQHRIWVGDSYLGAVNSVDTRTGRIVTRTKLEHVSDVAVGEHAVWAAVDKPNELVRLDPTTGRQIGHPLPIPGTPSGLAIGFGSIWVLTGDAVLRVQP
jgi:streptogramin lyase